MGRERFGPVFDLTEHELALAEQWQAEILEAIARRPRPNYTGIEIPGRFSNGYMGEFANGRLLQQHWTFFIHIVRTDGESAPSEFLVMDKDGILKELEVKTRMNPNATDFRFLESQKLDCDILVGARRLSRLSVEVCGYIGIKEFLARYKIEEHYGKRYRVLPYSEMRNVMELPKWLSSVRHMNLHKDYRGIDERDRQPA